MENSRRQFLQSIVKLMAGPSMIPLAQAGDVLETKHKGVRYGMVVDLRRCVGCQACTVGCSFENATPLEQFRTTVDQVEVTENAKTAFLMLPRLCNHCEHPACIPVCPTGATFQLEDGVVVVDNDWCVGCGYCVEACPYDARFINKETNTADKCTFCHHRLEKGLLPACVETCVGGARVIGDIHDPNSEASKLIRQFHDRIRVLRPEEGTDPCVFYIGLDEAFEEKIYGEPTVYGAINADGKELPHAD